MTSAGYLRFPHVRGDLLTFVAEDDIWLAAASGGRVIPVAGGVLIRDAEGEIIGAVGASGDLPDNDEACAPPPPGAGPGGFPPTGLRSVIRG